MEGDLLMGDDNTPRVVQYGSLTTGEAEMYEIQPMWSGAEPMVVNGDHILVLKINLRPWIWKDKRGAIVKYIVYTFEQLPQYKVQRRFVGKFTSESVARAVIANIEWSPIEWHVSVQDFLKAPATIKPWAKLFKPSFVQFEYHSLIAPMLTTLMGATPSEHLCILTSWLLGMWITDGNSIKPEISQGSGNHDEIFARFQEWAQLTNSVYQQRLTKPSTTTHAKHPFYVCTFHEHGQMKVSLFYRILSHLNLLNNKHIPARMNNESEQIRMSLFAGIVDGDGHAEQKSRQYSFGSVDTEFLKQVKFLVDGLRYTCGGLRAASKIYGSGTRLVYYLSIGGELSRLAPYVALTYKRFGPDPESSHRADKNCWGFKVIPKGIGGYYGFTLDGNHRVLMGDYTISHNTFRFVLHNLSPFLINSILTVAFFKFTVFKSFNNF